MKQYNIKIRLRAVPLCDEIVKFIQKNCDLIDALKIGKYFLFLIKF